MQQYFKFFFLQKAGAFGNKIKKEPPEPRPKLKRYVHIFTENICSACNLMQVVFFAKIY